MGTPPKIRVLVADDEETALILMSAVLEKAGFEIYTAADGEEVIQQFRDNPCDMVMLDVSMPKMDGFETLIVLRQEFGDELPIIMVTGMDDMVSIEKAYEFGATDFISKPINWSLIGHRIRYLFRAFLNLQNLRITNAHNSAILSAIPDTLFRVDNAGVILDVFKGSKDQVIAEKLKSGSLLTQCLPEKIAVNLEQKIIQAHDTRFTQDIGFTIENNQEADAHYEARVVSIDNRETLCLLRNITESKEAESKIIKLAYFDTLTGLPNRRSFLDRLEKEIRRNKVHKNKLAVMFIGLDSFKIINDTMGYATGDSLLQLAADRLRDGFRPSDMVSRAEVTNVNTELARPGGDVFGILVPIDQTKEIFYVAERIRGMMNEPFVTGEYNLVLTTSIGIAVCPENGEDAEALLEYASIAMHHAKENGGNNSQFYDTAFTQQAMSRLTMENSLRLALERDEFYLVYQPQYNLETRFISSVEALIRWQHPEKGVVSPLDFIPLAEESGLIIPIGEWVLREACKVAANWQQAGHDLRIAVNLSAKQFKDANLLKIVFDTLSVTGLKPTLLELEITENSLMSDSEGILLILNKLREQGIQIALDDFGTGFSSMSYLKRLPLNSLKVDQSFIKGLPEDKENLAIVSAIISMAKNLGFTVTAEGIETLEQAQMLECLSSDFLQGYYFSKPIPANEILAMLAKRWVTE